VSIIQHAVTVGKGLQIHRKIQIRVNMC